MAAQVQFPRFTDCVIRKTGDEMDNIRQKTLAYEYLCHLEETRIWLEACLKEKLPLTTELEENLRNGVYLAKLGNFITIDEVAKHKIYDADQERYKRFGLQFRHTDNINWWLKTLLIVDLPSTFHPETTDVYDKKNMPKVIYCLHALSAHLFKLGRAPIIVDLYGKANFTDEEINKMSENLQRYGIVMPSFQKIGGLLSTNLGDIESLHSAIININRAIDSNIGFGSEIKNSAAKLEHIIPELSPLYLEALKDAKKNKIQALLNRSSNEDYVSDVYDKLLTQAEIQGFIISVNTTHILKQLKDSLITHNIEAFFAVLRSPLLQLNNVKIENRNMYFSQLKSIYDNHCGSLLDEISCVKKIQLIVSNINSEIDADHMKQKAVLSINKMLDKNDFEGLCESLLHLNKFSKTKIERDYLPLFYEELQLYKIDHNKELSYEDIEKNIKLLSLIARITKMLDLNNSQLLWESLNNKMLELHGLRYEVLQQYIVGLKAAHTAKKQHGLFCNFLTLTDIQECIDEINSHDDDTQELIFHLETINNSIKNNNQEELMKILNNKKYFHSIPIKNNESTLYLNLLKLCMKRKNSELWLEDVQEVLVNANNEISEVENGCKTLVALNLALLRIDSVGFIKYLREFGCIIENREAKTLFENFSHIFERNGMQNQCPWVVFHTSSGRTAYINIETYSHFWVTPKDFSPDSRYFSKKDVIQLFKNYKTDSDDNKAKKMVQNITKVQAHMRGYLVRRKYSRIIYIRKHINEIVKIQAWWRAKHIQRQYRDVLKERFEFIRRNKTEDKFLHYKMNERKVVHIQALWRGKQARQAFLSLIHTKNPSFTVVKYFVPLLDFSTDDYEKELQLQTLRAEVVQIIRKNQKLSKQLEDMDIKIGLLIQNRISLQDVLAHGKKVNDIFKSGNSTIQSDTIKVSDKQTIKSYVSTSVRGMKTLTKENHLLVEGYQQLFYLLQTNPKYLSKLLFCLPPSRTTQFLESVMHTLYNFGSSARDEYLLLKLFRCSLEQEIGCQFNKPMDVITGNLLVLRMVVKHAREMNGLMSLRNIIGPLVEKVINNKNIIIETSPVDIYKSWRNQMECATGKPLSLPFTVTQEEALSYEEVRLRLKHSIEVLKTMVTMFLERLISCYETIPFSIKYMARVLQHILIKKFPSSPEKEILKVIGHLVYYQFINATIVAPDAFNIITLSHDAALTNDQRRNLASIAKILHFSASKKGFGDESSHLQCLNTFIIECHEKMKEFFRKCCQGATLEEYFLIDEYSEAALLYKPQIYISVQEICDTHSLILEYENIVAPDHSDKLHDVLTALGPTEPDGVFPIVALASSSDTKICLTLIDKNQHLPDDLTDINKLFIKTKELCVSVMPFLNGEHLLQAVCIGTTKQQQDAYKAHIEKRMYSGMIKPHECMTLREHIAQLRKYLNKLEEEGYVTGEDGYQSIITAIALDLCNKSKYRKSQLKALQMMKNTRKVLYEKYQFYQDQCNHYNLYINKCLENLSAGKRTVHSIIDHKNKSHRKIKQVSIKCSASKLHDKGILIQIDGLTVSQFKNVLFEITPTEHNGIFTIRGKFMGVEVDKIDLDIQHLLQLQYDGCAVMDLFGKAKVNVNLLLFFLNSKFYCKNK